MKIPDHLEWMAEPKLSRVEKWMRKRSVRITCAYLAFAVMMLVIMSAPHWGPIIDAVEVACR